MITVGLNLQCGYLELPGKVMPSPTDSSLSLTARTSRSLSHLRVQRTWSQILLALGFVQVTLGVLIVSCSLVAATITPSLKIKHSCPSWAGFSLALSGLIGVVSWKRPFTLMITFFTLLSALCVMLNLAGSILSCQNAQLVRSFDLCQRVKSSYTQYSRIHTDGFLQDWCVCCQAQEEQALPPTCRKEEDMITMYPNPECKSIRSALKLVPQRSTSVNLECVSPQETFLRSILEFEEFVPPVPPPPYYPPEYTCSSETDAQSITYNGSMDSPIPLHPTDFPPSYESVMGLRGDSQATLNVFDAQTQEGTHLSPSNGFSSTVLSGEVSMDSASLVMSEIIDIPDDSSPSEDSCLLDMQGSVRSVDYVLFRSIQRSRADYCLSVDCVQCGHHLRSPTVGLQGPFEENPLPRVRGERSYSCSTPGERHEALPQVGGADTRSCNRLESIAHSAGPCFPEVRVKGKNSTRGARNGGHACPHHGASCQASQCPQRRYSELSQPHTPVGATAPRTLMKSHSDPGISSSHEVDFQDLLYTKTLEDDGPNVFNDTDLCPEVGPARSGSPHLVRARSVGKSRLRATKEVVQRLSQSGALSLGDLKVCRSTKVLVTRFLQRSKRNLATGTDHAGSSDSCQKQIPQDLLHIPAQEAMHLQSCGDLSSTSSLRRLLSGGRLESGRRRPHSLNGTYKESMV
ncbi:protein ENTREP3 isoform X2 [Ambystoma mexicanum]|uniref:protein ENTREP3 isoform X2 n=1 Tax=Ambystoma mexicanum TaxID=8296 RepID=UPI0037E8E6D6